MNMLESISSYNFVEIDGYAYFSNLFYNALFKVDIKNGKTTFLGYFKDEKIAETNIHFGVMIKEGKICFFPRLGRHMHVYDLSDGKIQSIEIRKESEPLFWIEDVVFKDDFVLFLPRQNNVPIKKVKWDTYKVSNINNRQNVNGEYLFKYRNFVPETIIEKYKIKYGEVASCKQIFDGKWYFFKPIGRQISYFTRASNELENIILTVINEDELKKHIGEVKKNLFKTRTFYVEYEGFRLQGFLEVLRLSDGTERECYEGGNKYSSSKMVWKSMKECK